MAKILLCYRIDYYGKVPVETYSRSFHRALKELGHVVTPVGEGHPIHNINTMGIGNRKQYDLFIDLDCGRNGKGNLHFQNTENERKIKMPSAVRFIDTHGYPSLHRRIAKKYDHVFFAVWDRRDLFANLESAHWCPNATDSKFFDRDNHNINDRDTVLYDAGFFGSKDGLNRANMLRSVCNRRNLRYDIREIGKFNKQRWPRTAEAMFNCRILFNHGQKHDGPNQRVMESMMMGRPLLCDRDKRSGMSRLFEEGEHYLGYETESELGNQIDWIFHKDNFELVENMVERAYKEVKEKHQVKNRVEQILEVCL